MPQNVKSAWKSFTRLLTFVRGACIFYTMNIEDRTEFWDLIGKIAGDLDDTDWQIIKLISEGESQSETAKLLGVHRNTVRKRLDRMKKLIGRLEIGVQV